jgi:hypothetical protein
MKEERSDLNQYWMRRYMLSKDYFSLKCKQSQLAKIIDKEKYIEITRPSCY